MPTLHLADSHVHLDDIRFQHDRAAVIERAVIAGVQTQIVPAVDAASWPPIRALCASGSGLHPAYGLHPMFIARHTPADLGGLPTWLETPGTVAVGEIGLDFHRGTVDADSQRHYFTAQLALARDYALPVIIHARQALEEVILTLRRFHGVRGVVHSFSGSLEQARRLWAAGFRLGIGGPISYSRAQRLRQIVAHMPLDYLLLESDAPDQPLAGHQGQRNEPACIAEILRHIADLRKESIETIASAVLANTQKLFGLPLSR